MRRRLLFASAGLAALLTLLTARHDALGANTAADRLRSLYRPIASPSNSSPRAIPAPAMPGQRPSAPVVPGAPVRWPPPPMPATGTMPAPPAVLPPLPGNGKVVPPPPPLPAVEPVAPFGPASGSPSFEGPPPGTSSVRILSDFVRYDRQTKQALAKGNVRIFQEDTVISTDEAHYDQANKITTILVPFQLIQAKGNGPKTTLKGDSMTIYHAQKHVVVVGGVDLVREGQPDAQPANHSSREKLKTALKREDTVINADHMDYYTNTKDARFDGNVHFIQKEKNATSDHAYLDNGHNLMTMDGDVTLTQIKGDWLTRNGIVDTSKPDPERDKALAAKTIITGDHLVVDQTTNDATMTGQIVTVLQKGKKATGKRAEYHDAAQTIVLTQDVRIAKEDGGYLKADRAVFHTNTEKFEAYG
ncbi:MAG: LPS export ABC transporter periplasmic protein LptC, partial [Cyanobacteria bacterium REEB65]|nr:LPS export ABC transporter periplasmic protein LptC [Cyanobacteria bacterium REEB65]